MDDPARMRGVERVGDFEAEVEDALERQRAAPDFLLERVAVEQFHHDEPLPGVFAHVVDRADVGVIERRGEARLTLESIERLRVGGELGRQELERDLTPQSGVFRAVNHPHAPAAEAIENPVMADDGPYHGNARDHPISGRAGHLRSLALGG